MPIVFEVETPPERKNTDTSGTQVLPDSEDQKEKSPPIWTVSKLTRQIRMVLEGQFRSITLEGEISNYKRSAQGHLYFVLKDDQSQIRGVMFRHSAQSLKFNPEDGLEVIVKAHVSVYAPRGEYQLNISSMEPKGIGALQLAFEQLKTKLKEEGLFDNRFKQEIPFIPRRIGIVTSPTGAVIHDMLTVLQRRFPGIPVLLFPASVQGDQAAPELVEGVQYLNSLKDQLNIDVIIIGRGGGSIEDLWAFNDETLARTIFASEIPIISAVGHETDFTICDFISDLRAPTPSAAMELAVPRLQDLKYTTQDHTSRLKRAIEKEIEKLKINVESKTRHLVTPENVIRQHIQRVDEMTSLLHLKFGIFSDSTKEYLSKLNEKLHLLNPTKDIAILQKNVKLLENQLIQQTENYLNTSKVQLQKQVELLDSLSPLAVMKRGYTQVMDVDGKLIGTVHAININQNLNIRFHDGTAEAVVSQKHVKDRIP